ncbi:unnamed protein product [Microthlaspi erraticum]|uniref:NYN domain-containing protein n=1 Tax=Microthlaspi erraticum TaxID=1685480 RepID=A0A6D2HLL3_9BRAS|nr:unnamed protein product [Microthlaspi erraticum]
MCLGEFAYSKTYVLWDVDDWPSPNFDNPRLIFDLKRQYTHAGFRYRYCHHDDQGDNKRLKVAEMVHDIIVRHGKLQQGEVANFIVLANISEELMVYILVTMKSRGHNVVFARNRQSLEEDGDSSLVGRLYESGISEWTCPPNLLDETFETFEDESLKWC